jgi:RNA 2',3'-cyclic 3'-phosphodiesterase
VGRGAGRPGGHQSLTDGSRRTGSLRLFVAVPLPPHAVAAAAAILDAVGPPGEARGIRWVIADRLHVTLRFLGAAPRAAVPDVAAAVREGTLGMSAFRVTIAGAGAFPSIERPRVLWLGLTQGADELTALAAALDPPLARVGWAPPARPVRAHLTVARTDAAGYDGGAAAARALIAAAEGRSSTFDADRVVLFQSHLGRGPARYEALAEADLLPVAVGRPVAPDPLVG